MLTPGTYWLALHNGPLTYISTQNVYWETASNSSPIPSQTIIAPFTGDWWSDFENSKVAFQLTGVLAPIISSVSYRTTPPSLVFSSVSGRTYRAEYKNNLTDTAWSTVPGPATYGGTGNKVTVTDSDPNIRNFPRRFYRVVML